MLLVSGVVLKMNTSTTCCLCYSDLVLRLIGTPEGWGVLQGQVSVCLGGGAVTVYWKRNLLSVTHSNEYGLGFNIFCLCFAVATAC